MVIVGRLRGLVVRSKWVEGICFATRGLKGSGSKGSISAGNQKKKQFAEMPSSSHSHPPISSLVLAFNDMPFRALSRAQVIVMTEKDVVGEKKGAKKNDAYRI